MDTLQFWLSSAVGIMASHMPVMESIPIEMERLAKLLAKPTQSIGIRPKRSDALPTRAAPTSDKPERRDVCPPLHNALHPSLSRRVCMKGNVTAPAVTATNDMTDPIWIQRCDDISLVDRGNLLMADLRIKHAETKHMRAPTKSDTYAEDEITAIGVVGSGGGGGGGGFCHGHPRLDEAKFSMVKE